MSLEPVTKADAIRRKRTRYFTGKACRFGHVAERMVCNNRCVECDRLKDHGAARQKWRQDWRARRKAAGQDTNGVVSGHRYNQEIGVFTDRVDIPDQVEIDRRQRRNLAPLDLVGQMMGDPPPGYSALDEMRRRSSLAGALASRKCGRD